MTSKDDSKCPVVLEERRRSPLDQLPPPANSNKPLTPFSIEDILNKPSVRRSYSLCGAAHLISPGEKLPSAGHSVSGRALLSQTSPLCALEELASKTFKGLEVSVLQAAEGRDGLTLFGQRNTPKKRRKSRTAFTNHQIYELEKRFLYQKYLSPADRDQIAQQLGLTNAQVITWFQNRRAKLKRDLEEMKADVESAKSVGTVAFEKLAKLAELEKCAAGGMGGGPVTASGHTESDPISSRSHHDTTESLDSSRPHMSPPSPASSRYTDRLSSKCCSEDEDEEIDVDD
ncbi:transcription factor LBX1a [Thunnus albacares]|uniref:transcription factor LBX1a n=1 Tax=Thunnus maccoyii TaxID=8240 RepID=UPI001C4C6809|nr:transcription factor LBX1a [Thunnus maccoyii]XP_042290008.1 transcription factor LBX1a [Thunnus maccoyii]XP_042290009.1 transcription factor LBX1a [Thunnus maccoyii]XP_044229240.1 transcription factor LBX1a [Thunnus albacares]